MLIEQPMMIPAGCHMAMDKTKVTTPSLSKGGSGSSTEMRRQDQIPNPVLHMSIYLPLLELFFY
jgi:hypothetical protein